MHVDKARSAPGILTHRQYDQVMGEGKGEIITTKQDNDNDNDKDKDWGLKKEKEQNSDKDTEKDNDKVLVQGSDQVALVPQVHADSCHYCAGGLFRAANLLLSDVINHRQRCPYTR